MIENKETQMIVSDEKDNYSLFKINVKNAVFINTRKSQTIFGNANELNYTSLNELNTNKLKIDVKIDIESEDQIIKLKQLDNNGRIKVHFRDFAFDDGIGYLTVQGRINFIRILDNYIWVTFNQFNYMKTEKVAISRNYDDSKKMWEDWVKVETLKMYDELPITKDLF